MYGYDTRSARIFTEMGVELPGVDFIVPLQSLVVSGGEPFVQAYYATQFPVCAGHQGILCHMPHMYAGAHIAVRKFPHVRHAWLLIWPGVVSCMVVAHLRL